MPDRLGCTVKLKLRPAQERQLLRWLVHLTGVYNWTLKQIAHDIECGTRRSSWTLEACLNGVGRRIGVGQVAVDGAVRTAHEAWKRHLAGQCRRPRFKGHRNKLNTITFVDGMRLDGFKLRFACLGWLTFHRQDVPAGHIGMARIIRRASGWYAVLAIQALPKPLVAGGQTVGIDPGFGSLLTLSSGDKVLHPRELDRSAIRLAQAQRGWRNRLTARLLERQANRRKDRNHKLARRLVEGHKIIAWSKDNAKGIFRRFGKSVRSSAHSELRSMLAYKCRAGGAEFIEVPSRNSTRTCSACGALTGPTGYAGLSVRQWACPACGVEHDRDINAAINTLNAGLGISLEGGRKAASGIATEASRRSSIMPDPALAMEVA